MARRGGGGLAAALALVVLLAPPALAQGHMHMDMPAKAAPAAPGPVLYTPDDLHFLQHMIMHHRQALDMAALIEGRTDRAEFVRFAGYVEGAQRAEIAAMQGLLDLAAERGLSLPMQMDQGDPPMAGMLSKAEMQALAAAKGPAFERLWLQGMIFHHEGGLAMARAQELRQAMDGREPYGLAAMLDDILVNQRGEITRMQGWLQAWGLAEPGDRRPPAVEVSGPAPGDEVRAGRPVTLLGVAVDDVGVAAVQVAVHDLQTDRWLGSGGRWGPRQALPADLIGSGPASAAWRLAFTPPAPGRYQVLPEAVDTAGKRAAAPGPWTLDVN